MATRIIRVEVCDICGSEDKLVKFRITEQGGESRGITLCQDPEHGAPVIRKIRDKALKKSPPKTRGKRASVTTLEEIAAIKKTSSSRKARKRA